MKKESPIFYEPYDLEGKDLEDLLNQFPPSLRSHSRHVAVCSAMMAEHANEFLHLYDIHNGSDFALTLHLGGTCHDIGKLLLPALTMDAESYRRHAVIGAELLDKYKTNLFDSEAQARMVLDIVRNHHERPDGKGFPDGLQAEDIPLAAGICALADWLDHCLYGKQRGGTIAGDIFREVKAQRGKLFCQNAVTCFEHAWPELKVRYEEWNQRCV